MSKTVHESKRIWRLEAAVQCSNIVNCRLSHLKTHLLILSCYTTFPIKILYTKLEKILQTNLIKNMPLTNLKSNMPNKTHARIHLRMKKINLIILLRLTIKLWTTKINLETICIALKRLLNKTWIILNISILTMKDKIWRNIPKTVKCWKRDGWKELLD